MKKGRVQSPPCQIYDTPRGHVCSGQAEVQGVKMIAAMTVNTSKSKRLNDNNDMILKHVTGHRMSGFNIKRTIHRTNHYFKNTYPSHGKYIGYLYSTNPRFLK